MAYVLAALGVAAGVVGLVEHIVRTTPSGRQPAEFREWKKAA